MPSTSQRSTNLVALHEQVMATLLQAHALRKQPVLPAAALQVSRSAGQLFSCRLQQSAGARCPTLVLACGGCLAAVVRSKACRRWAGPCWSGLQLLPSSRVWLYSAHLAKRAPAEWHMCASRTLLDAAADQALRLHPGAHGGPAGQVPDRPGPGQRGDTRTAGAAGWGRGLAGHGAGVCSDTAAYAAACTRNSCCPGVGVVHRRGLRASCC